MSVGGGKNEDEYVSSPPDEMKTEHRATKNTAQPTKQAAATNRAVVLN